MYRLSITDVKFLKDYNLNILLSNGHGVLYNIAPKLRTARFQALQSESIYYSGYLSANGVICWQDGTELTLDEIVLELTNQIPYHTPCG